MNTTANFSIPVFCRILLSLIIIFSLFKQPLQAQNYEAKSVIYNTLLGGLSGGIGAVINKKPDQKWFKAFRKGFLTAACGGAIVYSGKKINYLVGEKKELGYAWLSRIVFSAGNSIVENASANIDVWKRWHFDVGFIRLEFKTGPFNFTPRIMPSALGGIIFLASNSKFNVSETIRSGTFTFYTSVINYAPQLVASTPTNGIVHVTSLRGPIFYETYAHEMIHTFQFQEFSGVNYFFKPVSDKWKIKSNSFRKLSKWVYLDINYELMGANYFLIQGGYKKNYCNNFLENEAEFLSTGRPACK